MLMFKKIDADGICRSGGGGQCSKDNQKLHGDEVADGVEKVITACASMSSGGAADGFAE
jgi:hypothetical protein